MFHWISAMIAAPALIYGGRFFYQSAWNALKHGRTNMDVPIALAITLSYAVSLWETIHHGEHAWFDATVSLLFFLLIGRTLDHIMRDKARSAIAGLARLSPRGATVIDADGVRDYRPLADIEPGMSIAIAAGDRVAVDAVVVCGSSDLDMYKRERCLWQATRSVRNDRARKARRHLSTIHAFAAFSIRS